MLNQHQKKQQLLTKVGKSRALGNKCCQVNLRVMGHWDSRIAQADPDPEMITNSHYWQGYCDGMYQRYLEKYGINRSN